MIARLVVLLVAALLSGVAAAETIGLRFVVSADLGASPEQRRATSRRIQANVEQLNDYFRNSEVRLAAEVVDIDFARMDDQDVMAVLRDMKTGTGAFADLWQKADEFGADFSFAVLDRLMLRGKRGCGRAFAVNRNLAEISDTRRAFAAIDYACGAHTLAHELGHLMGLNHGALVDRCQPDQGHANAIAPYALGWSEGNCDGEPQAGEYGTIMVGGWMKAINGDGHGNLPMFSNPRIHDPRCGAHGRCGNPDRGDAARALNENARIYSGHEEPDVHALPFADAGLADCLREQYRGVEIRDLTEIRCAERNIRSLRGIERLTALRRMDFRGNPLSDVEYLDAIAGQIEWLDASGAALAACPQLRNLKTGRMGKFLTPAECR